MKVIEYVKEYNDVPQDETSFDKQLYANTNSALATLNQLGVGKEVYLTPDEGDIDFDDFFEDKDSKLVRSLSIDFIGLSVMFKFDTPVTAQKGKNNAQALEELEFRIYMKADADIVAANRES